MKQDLFLSAYGYHGNMTECGDKKLLQTASVHMRRTSQVGFVGQAVTPPPYLDFFASTTRLMIFSMNFCLYSQDNSIEIPDSI